MSRKDAAALDLEIAGLLNKGVIFPCAHEEIEFFSPIFPVLNSDESVRMILNLKKLNEYATYHPFKMDTIHR